MAYNGTVFENRYKRNSTTISSEENTILASKKVIIAGCGGLGGYILEMLLRIGIGEIRAADPDSFEESNLNRQLLCVESSLGMPKSKAASHRASQVNSSVKFTAFKEKIDRGNALKICRGTDLIIDALDSPEDRLILQWAAEELGIPLIHGAIAGWYGQVSTIFPGDKSLSSLYGSDKDRGDEVELGTPSFTPAVIAGIQVSEALKVLLCKEPVLRNKILYIDLLNNQFLELEL